MDQTNTGRAPVRRVRVNLGRNSYTIRIGALTSPELAAAIQRLARDRQVMVVTDANVSAAGHADAALELLSDASELGMITLKPGEKTKTMAVVEDVCRFAAANNFDRGCLFAAVSGGVAGDLTGFAAGIYKRGAQFIQIPTTLLAMVDSSVGGKTGADIPEGKNLVGLFNQPRAVFIDPAILSTLPARELRNGMAEVVKYGVIRDRELFRELSGLGGRLVTGCGADMYGGIIERCCSIKAEIVSEDEKERGVRALLNFGHSFGHAVELLSNFRVAHGRAVACGMAMAGRFAVKSGVFPEEEQRELEELLSKLRLPVSSPVTASSDEFLNAMLGDKKNTAGKITLILPERIGAARIVRQEDVRPLRDFLAGELK